MATPIKAVPILTGETADEFIRLPEENELHPRRTSSARQREVVKEMERQLREFVPSWKR